MKTSRAALFFWALALALPVGALDVPFLSGRVVDEAGLLSPEASTSIEAKLAKLEAETGAQVAILTVPTLDGDPLEDFSLRVAETWKLGKKGKDDGALFFVARDDRKMRLEVGYGLEGQLTDFATKRILDDIVRPSFKSGDFAGGLEKGVDAIDTTIRKGADAVEAPQAVADSEAPSTLVGGLVAPFIFAVIGLFLPGCLFAAPLGMSTLMVFGVATAFLGVPGGAILTFLWVLVFSLLRRFFSKLGLIAKASQWGTVKGPLGRRTWTSGGGGWGGGGGWSSGGGGGGGFSGGGGSFGGGGSSSSW